MNTALHRVVIRALLRTAATSPPRAVAAAPLALVLVAGIHGCAAPPGGGPQPRDLVCHSAQQCRVQVEVSCGAGGCRAAVDHPRVFAQGNDVVWIVENKAGQSYAFPADDGIFFKTDAGRNAFRCRREGGGDRYACMNRKTKGTFEYGVRLSGSPAVPTLDPWVVN